MFTSQHSHLLDKMILQVIFDFLKNFSLIKEDVKNNYFLLLDHEKLDLAMKIITPNKSFFPPGFEN